MTSLISQLYLQQIGVFASTIAVLFIVFEIVPLLFGMQSTVKKNFRDLFLFQIVRGLYAVVFGTTLFILIKMLNIDFGIIDITHLSTFSQFIILYFFSELAIYLSHMLSHRYRIPLLSKAHRFHHSIQDDLQWVNSRKEHLLVISLFVAVFCIFFYIIFKSNNISHLITVTTFLTLLSFSHFRIPVSIPYLDHVFLFPKDHARHHAKYGGPYGVTTSIFDTLFNTRESVTSANKS